MAPEKSPAFQFYPPKEFLIDGNVAGMSLQERGAYITLLCICWQEQSLPVDLNRLANMSLINGGADERRPPEVRRLVYTTNALESVHAQLRKIIKTRGHFPNDDAATKLIWLALRNITAKWDRMSHYWRPAMNQFAILYEGRFPPSTA